MPFPALSLHLLSRFASLDELIMLARVKHFLGFITCLSNRTIEAKLDLAMGHSLTREVLVSVIDSATGMELGMPTFFLFCSM